MRIFKTFYLSLEYFVWISALVFAFFEIFFLSESANFSENLFVFVVVGLVTLASCLMVHMLRQYVGPKF